MSKSPPIGWPWLEQMLFQHLQTGSVPPRLSFRIPERKGEWVPRGSIRKRLLAELRDLNAGFRAKHGRDTPQWSSLLTSLKDSPYDLEILTYGKEIEELDTPEKFERDNRLRSGEFERARTVRTCGSSLPCWQCLLEATPANRAQLGVVDIYDAGYWAGFGKEGAEHPRAEVAAAQRDGRGGGVHPLCKRRGEKSIRHAFPKTGPQTADRTGHGEGPQTGHLQTPARRAGN